MLQTRDWTLHRPATLTESDVESLASVLIDCVDGGGSLGFMHPLSRDRALAFWRNVARELEGGRRIVLLAHDDLGVCGTVQLIVDMPDNQPHRADLVKMMVHRRARRRGLGAALMRAAEAAAKERGKTLLVLDAVTGGDAARLYERLGWRRAGEIPRYALLPRGGLTATTYYYRDLDEPAPTESRP